VLYVFEEVKLLDGRRDKMNKHIIFGAVALVTLMAARASAQEKQGATGTEAAKTPPAKTEKAKDDKVAPAKTEKAKDDKVAPAKTEKAKDDKVAPAKTEKAKDDKVAPAKTEKAAGVKAAPAKAKGEKGKVKEEQPAPPPPPPPPRENTFELCQDRADNDGDGHVDCDDQDCEVFAACVQKAGRPNKMTEPPQAPEAGPVDCSDGKDNDGNGKIDCVDEACLYEYWCRSTPTAWNAPTEQGAQCGDSLDNDADGLVDCDEPACNASVYCVPGPEEGLRCRDNKDNDKNGLIDCEEEGCRRSYYCRKRIYYTPLTPGRPMAWMVSLGVGLALPNWSQPEANGEVLENGSRQPVPFDAKVGLALNLEVAYMPLSWLGGGISSTIAGIWDSSREPFETDYTTYKYDAAKLQGSIGGFVRLQVPVWERFVPFVNLHVGYTYSKYYWVVYPATDSWSNIDQGYYSARATPEYGVGHASFMVEPGFDAFVRARTVAIGLRAQLPVATIKWSAHSTDSAALFLSVSYTPTWRERPVIRPEYANPVPRTAEEQTTSPAAAEDKPVDPSAAPSSEPLPPAAEPTQKQTGGAVEAAPKPKQVR
jgi:hypothetical protein